MATYIGSTEISNAYVGIPSPTSIVLDKSSISLTTVGQTEQLTATIEPTISDHSITWSSDDTTIATVDTTGLVTCVTPGTCTITATTVNNLTATCSVDDSQGWQPGANTIGYYTMNNNILNHATTGSTFPDGVLNTATFSTTRVHGTNTYSLYCDGSTYAYLPTGSLAQFGTNDFTISCWVYSETNSGVHPGIISNYYSSGDHLNGWRITDRFNNNNNLSFCWRPSSYVDNTSGISIYNDGWHNIVFTRNGGVFKVYLDTNLVITDSGHTGAQIGRNANINFGYNPADNLYSKVYMNDVIFENVGWSSQDVADYYNLTNV